MNMKPFAAEEKLKVLIVAKTIPTESFKHEETVCTAGVTDDGRWVRLYPIPFRLMDGEKQFKKYQWIEVGTRTPEKVRDRRPESRRCDIDSIKLLDIIKPDNEGWKSRREICITPMTVFTNFEEMIKASRKENGDMSLAVFKPTKIINCTLDPKPQKKIQEQLDKQNQIREMKTASLFEQEDFKDFVQAEPFPYYLHYTFEDSVGTKHKIMVEDWEVYSLYRQYKNKPEQAKQEVLKKYRDFASPQYDTYFFMGTRFMDHMKNRPNPFSIIGVFYPKVNPQKTLF